jgi:tetratricopeptide (TPR) repeat protein
MRLFNHLRIDHSTILACLLTVVSQSASGDRAIANNQGPSLDQLRTEYAMRFLEPAPHMALAKYFSDHGNRLQAFYILENARRGRFKEEEFDEAFARMFRWAKAHDHGPAAEAALTTEHNRDPNSIDTVVKLADIYVYRKDWTKAKEYISKAIRLQPEDFENTEALAEVLRREDKREDAVRLLRDYAHKYPETLHGYQLRVAEVLEKEPGKATSLLSEAIKQFPQEGGFVFYLGTILQREGKLREAEDHFVRAAGMSPDSVLIQAWVGRFFYKVKKDDRRALDYYLNAYLLDPHAYETEFVESRIPKINAVLARADYERQVKSGVPLAKILEDPNPAVVYNALEQLSVKWEPAYLKMLLDLMGHDDGGVRWQATMIIKEKVDSSFDGTLKALLEDKDLRKRGLAAYIAVGHWKQESFGWMRSMLREESQLLRFDAVSVLILEGGPQGREILSEHLSVEPNPQMKMMIERAIAREARKP